MERRRDEKLKKKLDKAINFENDEIQKRIKREKKEME